MTVRVSFGSPRNLLLVNSAMDRCETESDTLVDLLMRRATLSGDQRAFTFLVDGDTQALHVTYRQLDQQARSIAATLRSFGAAGQRAVLLYPPGLDYIAAFFGCLYAGVVAVPAYPPQRKRMLPRLQAILPDCEPAVALSSAPVRTALERLCGDDEALRHLKTLQWLDSDAICPGRESDWQRPAITERTLAFLQYTSGSTGTPKGVMLTHRNLLHNQRVIQSGFGHSSQTIVVGWLPLYHDMGLIGNVFQPLYLGVPGILMSPYHFLQQPLRWLAAISRYRATTSGGPNFAYDLCARRITAEQRATLDLSCWQVAFNGAEPVRARTLERFVEFFRPCGFRREAFYPCYGLAEATLMVSGGVPGAPPVLCRVRQTALEQHAALEAGEEDGKVQMLVSSGTAQRDQQILIVHPGSLMPCPEGEIGEVWISGPSVAQGYWRREEDSAQTFHARVHDNGRGTWLRTGDLGFMRGGHLFVTGRLKDLIIIRGRNLYPHDIEMTVEQCHPALRPGSGAAFSVEVHEEEQLVVVQEVDPRTTADVNGMAAAIRRAVAEQHDIQVHTVVLIKHGSLPKTSSGKVQRGACRTRFLTHSLESIGASRHDVCDTRAANDPALTPVEHVVAGIWEEVLARPAIGRHDNFFALGGDSLRGTQVMARVREVLQVELTVDRLFEVPTVAELADFISKHIQERRDIPGRSNPIGAPCSATTGPYPLSFAQQRLWFLDQLMPGVPINNIPVALQVCGPLDVAALKQAITEIVRRHETLRTSFTSLDGHPVQIIAPPSPVEIPLIDLRSLSESEREAEAARFVAEAARQPFDLARGALLRVCVLQVRPWEHILLLTIHHIVADDWSMGILSRELAVLYAAFSAGAPSPLCDLTVQYRDVAQAQREWLQGGRLEEQLSYWKVQLAGSPPLLNLPTDRTRPSTPTFRGARRPLSLSQSLTGDLKSLAEREGATLFMVVLAAFKVLLHRYSGQNDICVGSTLANRRSIESEDLIGFFANMLVFRTRMAGDRTFLALLATVRETALGAYAHQDLPFEMLVEALHPDRDMSRTPLFQASLVLQNAPPPTLALSGLTITRLESHNGTSQFDLTLSLSEESGRLCGAFEYNMDLFDEAMIARMAGHFLNVLKHIARQPDGLVSAIPLLSEAESHQLLISWNEGEEAASPAGSPADCRRCLHELIEAQAGRTPDAVAVTWNGRSLTYGEINAQSNQVAHYLREEGVGPESLVAICLERSLEMVIAILGVLKAGGAYVPLDPAYPTHRIACILEDAQAALVLTQERLRPLVPANTARLVSLDADWAEITLRSSADVRNLAEAENLAYVIYTSGSTGRPKGVGITHRSAVALIDWAHSVYSKDDLQGVLASTSICFDLSVFELFVPLSIGGHVIMAENALALPAMKEAEAVTLINTVPSAIAELLCQGGIPTSARTVNLAGEPLSASLVDQLYELEGITRVFDLYGPSEDTTYSTYALRQHGGPVTIGRPITKTQIYIVDAHFNPLPVGVPGELYIGGAGLARGYRNRPALTAAQFVPHPFSPDPGARLYRTGDLARYRPDGTIEFLGRRDHQVKLRGFRIELGEIEAHLRQQPGVREAVVQVREDQPGHKRLVAYVVPRKAQETGPGDLRRFMKEQLPDYMVPAAFVLLDALPLTTNGKVDRAALPPPEEVCVQRDTVYEAPRSHVEQAIAAVWQEVLGVKTVGIHDNFFDLGGQSLLLAKVWSKLRGQFQREPTMLDLFHYPTIAALARSMMEQDMPTSVGLGAGVQSERRKSGQERLRQQRAQRRTAASRGGGTQ